MSRRQYGNSNGDGDDDDTTRDNAVTIIVGCGGVVVCGQLVSVRKTSQRRINNNNNNTLNYVRSRFTCVCVCVCITINKVFYRIMIDETLLKYSAGVQQGRAVKKCIIIFGIYDNRLVYNSYIYTYKYIYYIYHIYLPAHYTLQRNIVAYHILVAVAYITPICRYVHDK